jgi:hypothetical protein
MNEQPALFGYDLDGTPSQQVKKGLLSVLFDFPPFSVLDARGGQWKERKAAWLRTYRIEGEIDPAGRAEKLTVNMRAWAEEKGKTGAENTTSVFDPVLCELAYRWFAPPDGLVLDPFAGGAVRGLVAALSGYRYYGIELRAEQVAANLEQARRLAPDSLRVPVRVSGAQLRQRFQPCEPGYVAAVCGGACCRRSTGGVSVPIIECGTVRELTGDRCPHQDPVGLCALHGSPDKPLGCVASPFVLNEKDLLVVRNRYRLLRCYDTPDAVPAYVAFRAGLERIFGAAEAAILAAAAEAGADEIASSIAPDVYSDLRLLRAFRSGESTPVATPRLRWIIGDALEELEGAPAADFLFSCPPYGDLETYSDDPRDLSNMRWDEFLVAYRSIISKAVDRLRPDSFACFVVGDFRGPTGAYRAFPTETIRAFAAAGAELYNDAVLVTNIASLSLRARRPFEVARKLGKTHQNVLVFVKGDPRAATARITGYTGR